MGWTLTAWPKWRKGYEMGRSRLNEPLPWYQWSPQQWQASRKVARMDWAARGMYRELMDECWGKGAIPSTAEGIADLLDVPVEEVTPLLPQFIRCFDLNEDGTMTSPFIEAIRTESDARRISQANRRLGKDKHGKPKLTEENMGKPRLTTVNQSEVEEKRREEKRTEEESREQNTPQPPKGVRVKVERDPREFEILSLWNGMAARCGFPQAERLGSKRLTALRQRLSEAGWWDKIPKALEFLEKSAWHRENAASITLDTLLRPERVEQYVERAGAKPTTTGGTNGNRTPAHRAGVDAAYIDQLREHRRATTSHDPDERPLF